MESAFVNRPASPADSLRSIPVMHINGSTGRAAGQDLSLNRAACAAICVVDRCSANRREAYYYHLGKKIGWCS